jgi:hypothetical protein
MGLVNNLQKENVLTLAAVVVGFTLKVLLQT